MHKRHWAGTLLAVLTVVLGIMIGCSTKDASKAPEHGKIAQAVKLGDWCDCWYAGIDERLHDDGTGKADGGWLFCVESKTTPGSCSYQPDCILTSWCSASETPAWVPGSGTPPGFCVQKDGTMLSCFSNMLVPISALDGGLPDTSADTADATVTDTLTDTADTMDTADTTVVDTADTADTMDVADTADTLDVADTADTFDAMDTADTADTSDTPDTADTTVTDTGADTADTMMDVADTVDSTLADTLTDTADTLVDFGSDATFTPGVGCSDSPATGWVAEYYPKTGYSPPGSVTLQGHFEPGASFWMNSTATSGTPHCTMAKNGCGGYSCFALPIPADVKWVFNLRYGDPALPFGGGWAYDQCCWPTPTTPGGVPTHGGCGADYGTLLLKKDGVVRNIGATFTRIDNVPDDGLACTLNGVINPTP